jgi:hypothetical protein
MIVGWFRVARGAEWQAVVEGATLDQAHRRLLDATRGQSQDSKNRLLTAGQHPNTVLKEKDHEPGVRSSQL